MTRNANSVCARDRLEPVSACAASNSLPAKSNACAFHMATGDTTGEVGTMSGTITKRETMDSGKLSTPNGAIRMVTNSIVNPLSSFQSHQRRASANMQINCCQWNCSQKPGKETTSSGLAG